MNIIDLIGEATEYDKKLALEEKKPKSWCKSVSAFANTFGGALIFGISNEGMVVGLENPESDAEKISDDLKKNGGSIPGVRTGIETKNYIKRVLNQVTVAGSLTLCIIAAIPIITPIIWTQTENSSLSLGGTGLIIVTGVALETVKQIKTYITRKEYHGYIRK